MASSIWRELGRLIRRMLLEGRAVARQEPAGNQTARTSSVGQGSLLESPGQYGSGATADLARDDISRIVVDYAPDPDGDPDPGEIVWTWVPYVENDGRGKDRPVLIIGRLGADATVGCYLSTKQHRGFVSVGTGAWDSQGRESFLSTDRLLRITREGMRREGHVLPRDRFDRALAAIAEEYGIPY